MILFRPVGLEELLLIYRSGMRAFPPRLPDQPIFYPVLNGEYARQIAREWNTGTCSLAGLVTRFGVDDGYAERFERRVVGSRVHEELWVPAEELAEFNGHIAGLIEVTAAYFGEGYRGAIPREPCLLTARDLKGYFLGLEKALAYSGFDVLGETSLNHESMFLNYFWWEQQDFTADGMDIAARNRLLEALRHMWAMTGRSDIRLGLVDPSRGEDDILVR